MKRMNLILGRKNTEKRVSDTSENVEILCQKTCEDITETFVTLANEPSLAYFRIQEHVRKSTPTLLEERAKIVKLQTELQGRCFDLDYAIGTVNSASRATSHLVRLNELLKSGLFTKLQLDYAQQQRTIKPRRGERVERPPSVGTEVAGGTSTPSIAPGSSADSVAKLTTTALSSASPRPNSMSTAAVEVRRRAVNMTRRALFTRSADILSTDLGDIRSGLSLSDITRSTESNGVAHNRPSCESLLESDP